MPRRIQTTFTPGSRHSIAAIGDSLTHNATLGVHAHLFWPEVAAASLRDLGCSVQARNFARSGNTSTAMLARAGNMTRYDVPKLGIIEAGANDPGSGIVGATTQANIVTMGEALFAAGASYVLVNGIHYLNYASGGDTVATHSATYALLQTFQEAAAAELATAHPGKAAFCDVYAYLRALIVAGTEVQGSESWHTSPANQHYNDLGQGYIAAAVVAKIQSQAGWLNALK